MPTYTTISHIFYIYALSSTSILEGKLFFCLEDCFGCKRVLVKTLKKHVKFFLRAKTMAQEVLLVSALTAFTDVCLHWLLFLVHTISRNQKYDSVLTLNFNRKCTLKKHMDGGNRIRKYQ